MFKTKTKGAKFTQLQIESIEPCRFQPRRNFDMMELTELAQSIKIHGVLQPISVREIGFGKYELIAGERRLRASAMAGLRTIPAVISEHSDKEVAALALIENMQRADLHFFDEAVGIANFIIENGLTQDEASRLLGKSQPTIANKLRLLKLSEGIREMILEEALTERHARALLRLPVEKRGEALNIIVTKRLNVSETDNLIARMLKPKKATHRIVLRDVRIFLGTVNKAVRLMKKSGVDAQSDLRETDNYYECVVKIPKESSGKL